MIITVTHTIMDGTVVRWYRTVDAAEDHRPELSASRNGVSVHAEYLTSIPQAWVDVARQTFAVLASNPHADLEHMATHRRKGLFGPVQPVEAPATSGLIELG